MNRLENARRMKRMAEEIRASSLVSEEKKPEPKKEKPEDKAKKSKAKAKEEPKAEPAVEEKSDD